MMNSITANPTLADWLDEQEHGIVPTWISKVQQITTSIQHGKSTIHLQSAQLMCLFDGIVAALRAGDPSLMDVSIQDLVQDRLGHGYKLTDFLQIAYQLKFVIWQVTQDRMALEQTLQSIVDIEPLFVYSLSRLAWLAHRAAESQLEEELERARYTLEKLDRTKSNFIGIAAHELRTPLTLVQGYSALLSSAIGDTPRRQLKNAMQGLKVGCSRLEAIIKDMIDVSLIASEMLTLSLQKSSLTNMIRLAATDLKKEAADRKVDLRLGSFPRKVDSIYMDPMRMYQVFTNLLGNAIKYTPDGGKVTLEATLLPSQEEPLEYIEIAVADTGIGIDSDDLQHIFDQFYQIGDHELHSTSKTQFKGGGPGLGLAITKGIIEAHGGRIWAESPGHDEKRYPGSIFYVVLPLHIKAPIRSSERLLGLS